MQKPVLDIFLDILWKCSNYQSFLINDKGSRVCSKIKKLIRNAAIEWITVFTSLFFIAIQNGGFFPTPALAVKTPETGCIKQELQSFYKQLSPASEASYDLYTLKTDMTLDTLVLPDAPVNHMMNRIRQIKRENACPAVKNPAAPQLVIRNIAQSDVWQILEVSVVLPGQSWGVLMAKRKNEENWTAFYTIPGSDSKDQLYFQDNFKLTGDILSGSLCTKWEQGEDPEWGYFEISLNSFRIKPAFKYRFSDYPAASVYKGPAATLQTGSRLDEVRPYRTHIRNSLAAGVTFAGRYSVAEAGCGTECQVYIITDTKTGRVAASKGARAGALYQADSRLLIINTEPYCMTTGICEPSYFLMTEGELIELN